MARESPLERGSRFFITLLKIHEALLQVGERGKIIGREHLSLDDGEIDLNLIDPAGMNGGVYQKGVGPAGSNAFDCFLTAMSRSVGAMPLFLSCPKCLARWTSQAAR